jgi:alpha-L-fucosidase 2
MRLVSLLFLLFMGSTAYAHSVQSRPVRTINDIVYARVDGTDVAMDAALPESRQPTPAVVIVHGGGWVQGDRRNDVRPLFQPLSQAGFAWFSISYRLVTDVSQFGVAIDDVESAVRFIKSHAAEYNIDPDRLALLGESAGGQLAAMAVLRGGAAGSVRAVVGFYTPTDLVSLMENSTFIPAQIRSRVVGMPWERLVLAGLAQLSPVYNVRGDMPPFLLIHGTDDALVPLSQSTAMCKRMREAGATCDVYPVDGAGHGIRWWTASERASAERKMISWLDSELSIPTATPADASTNRH